MSQSVLPDNPIRYLALGDSYTIGESVEEEERWPNQLAEGLRQKGFTVDEVHIIATTGWRTDQLIDAIKEQDPEGYNLVSLLIGVNNQYQGKSLATYKEEFEELLVRALQLANNNPSHVFVLSIPDYAFTPFANGDTVISRELVEFNRANKKITAAYGVPYFNITDISQRGLQVPDLIAHDGLHPSGKMYKLWVDRILENINSITTDFKELKPQPDTSDIHVYIQDSALYVKTQFSETSLKLVSAGSGRLVLQQKLDPDTYNALNISNIKSGIYIYALYRNGVLIYSNKVFI